MKKIDKIIASILTFIGLPGQLLARAIYKNGSLNKPYLLLFAVPPFSIIPSIAVYFNFIKDAEIKDKPFDLYLLLGMILIIIIPFIINLIVDNKLLVNILVQISIVGIIQYIYNQKFDRICSKDNKIINSSMNHALLIAPISLLLARIIIIIINYICNKYNISLLDSINLDIFKRFLINNNNININDLFGLYLLTSLSFGIIYILLNMIYSSNFTNKIACDKDIKLINIIFLILINICISYVIKPKTLLVSNS